MSTFQSVKNLFSISFSILILMQSFGLRFNDLSQIDEFIQHAQFHSDQYGDNVLVFISKHYGELKADHDKEHHEEKEEHEELPFNHNNCSHNSIVTAFVLQTNKEEFNTLQFYEFKEHNFFYVAPSSSLHSEGLLQPPRYS